MKKINIFLLVILFPFLVSGSELDDLLKLCNEVFLQVRSAVYETHVVKTLNGEKTEYVQEVYIKKNNSKTGLPMFNLTQSRNDVTEFQQFFNNKQFTMVDFEEGVAYQYEKEDKSKYLPMIDQTTFHPYAFCKSFFSVKNRRQNLELMNDTIINDISYKRISRIWKQDDADRQDIFFINSANYIVEKQQSISMKRNGDVGLSILKYDIEYNNFKYDVAYIDERFVYKSNQMPYTLQYMSYSALKKEWLEQEKNQSSLAYGSFAEDFVVTDCYGERIDSKENRNEVLVVVFYYNICPPCMLMLQDLENLHRKYENKPLNIVAINPIDNSQNDDALRQFAKEKKLSYHLCGVERNTIEDAYLVYSYPTIFIIDKKGRIQFSHQGYNTLFFQKVDKVLKRLL